MNITKGWDLKNRKTYKSSPKVAGQLFSSLLLLFPSLGGLAAQ